MKKYIFVGLMAALGTFLYSDSSASAPNNNSIVLTEDNTLSLNGEVDGESVSEIINRAKELDLRLASKGVLKEGAVKKPLYLFLSTPGGSVQSGMELMEALNGLDRPVHTVTLFAASMGFQLAQNLGERHILKNGVLMSHRAAGQFEGQFGGEAPSQIDNRYALWKRRMDEMDEKTVSRTNGKQTLASYQHQYASEMWLTGSQAAEQGYADKVSTVKCDESLKGVVTKEIIFMGLIKINYDLDKCPLNTTPQNVRGSMSTTKGYVEISEFVKKGGEFTADCLIKSATDKEKLCALDTSLSLDRVTKMKKDFANQYGQKAHQVVDKF